MLSAGPLSLLLAGGPPPHQPPLEHEQSEAAVQAALRWLAAHQAEASSSTMTDAGTGYAWETVPEQKPGND